MNDTLKIMAATSGGYIVFKDGIDRGVTNEPLYAGGLSEALNFISEYFRSRHPAREAA